MHFYTDCEIFVFVYLVVIVMIEIKLLPYWNKTLVWLVSCVFLFGCIKKQIPKDGEAGDTFSKQFHTSQKYDSSYFIYQFIKLLLRICVHKIVYGYIDNLAKNICVMYEVTVDRPKKTLDLK